MKRESSPYTHIPVYAKRDRRHLVRTAYHEAGHAVMALALRRPFKTVTVSSTESVLGNVAGIDAGLPVEWLRTHRIGRLTLVHQEWSNALICLAGPAAEWMKKRSVLSASEDVFQAAEHLRAIRPELDNAAALRLAERCARPQAKSILEIAWPAVDLIAADLLEKGILQYGEADDSYRRALPDGVLYSLLRCPVAEGDDTDAVRLARGSVAR